MARLALALCAAFVLFISGCADEVEEHHYHYYGDRDGGSDNYSGDDDRQNPPPTNQGSGNNTDGSSGSGSPGHTTTPAPDPYENCKPVEFTIRSYSGAAYLDSIEGAAIDVTTAYSASSLPAYVDGTRCIPHGQDIQLTFSNNTDRYARIAITPDTVSSRPIAVSPPMDYCVEPHGYQGYLLVVPPRTYGYTVYVYPLEANDGFPTGSWDIFHYRADGNMIRAWSSGWAYVDTDPGACSHYDEW